MPKCPMCQQVEKSTLQHLEKMLRVEADCAEQGTAAGHGKDPSAARMLHRLANVVSMMISLARAVTMPIIHIVQTGSSASQSINSMPMRKPNQK